MVKIYALYKGEELLADGTIIQIAYKMGVKPRTIRYYKTPSYLRKFKNGKKRRELVEL